MILYIQMNKYLKIPSGPWVKTKSFVRKVEIKSGNVAGSVKEVVDLNGFNQGPLCGVQSDFMRESTRPEINLGPEYYA